MRQTVQLRIVDRHGIGLTSTGRSDPIVLYNVISIQPLALDKYQ